MLLESKSFNFPVSSQRQIVGSEIFLHFLFFAPGWEPKREQTKNIRDSVAGCLLPGTVSDFWVSVSANRFLFFGFLFSVCKGFFSKKVSLSK